MDEVVIEAGRGFKNYWTDLWRYRELFYFLAWRDIVVRYKQTVIGIGGARLCGETFLPAPAEPTPLKDSCSASNRRVCPSIYRAQPAAGPARRTGEGANRYPTIQASLNFPPALQSHEHRKRYIRLQHNRTTPCLPTKEGHLTCVCSETYRELAYKPLAALFKTHALPMT